MEVSLYFHIPFCHHKCPYCHFFVLPNQDELKAQYLEALFLEWQQKLPLLQGCKVVSIYFGGGTPPLIGVENIHKILTLVRKDLPLCDTCEITMETNPEEATLDLLQDAKKAGINRISIGVQSLDDSLLQVLDRRHEATLAIQAIENTKSAGIHNISIDLMYDIPHQTFTSWRNTLMRIKSLPITHLSLYNLTIEPHTLFHKNRKALTPSLPTPEVSLNMLEYGCNFLEQIGLKRYEISAFAKDNQLSRHNTGYWTARPFLGYGPSAFSYFDKKRFQNISNLSKYASKLKNNLTPVDFEEKLPYPNDLEELLAVQLRLLEGVDLEKFQEIHGLLHVQTLQKISSIAQKGWLTLKDQVLALTPQGMLFYDTIATELI